MPSKSSPQRTASSWRFGYAQADITPKPGSTVMMAGYGHDRTANGAVAPLRAQALALTEAAGQTGLILTADVLGFDRTSVEFLRQSILDRHNIAPAAVVLAASHTHWAPATLYRMNFGCGGLNVWYLRFLHNTLLELTAEALKSQSPATVKYGAVQTRIGCNRRPFDAKGNVYWGPYPEGHYDTHTPILQITRTQKPPASSSSSKPAAGSPPSSITLVGHACHPTSSGHIPQFTPDYPGAMRAAIEKADPTARGMFVMGCGADAKVSYRDEAGVEKFAGDVDRSHAAGRQLAKTVLQHLRSGDMVELAPRLKCRLIRGELTFAKRMAPEKMHGMAAKPEQDFDSLWAHQSLAYPDSRRHCAYEVQAWQLGDELTLITLEGEVCSPLGPLARSLAKTRHAMAVAYANTDEAYIPSRQIVLEGGYEGDTAHRAYFLPAPFTPRVESEFKSIVTRAVRALDSAGPAPRKRQKQSIA